MRQREYSVQSVQLNSSILRISAHDIENRFFDEYSLQTFKSIIKQKRKWRKLRLEQIILDMKFNSWGKSIKDILHFSDFSFYLNQKKRTSHEVYKKWKLKYGLQIKPKPDF